MGIPVVVEAVLLLLKVFFYILESLARMLVPVRPKDISGQTVLVTGAGRGIGRELAIRFSSKDTRIALWDVDKAGLQETLAELKVRGVTASAYQVDVTDTAAIRQAADAVRRDLGPVDILINNAGIAHGKPLLELQESEIRRTLDVNALAHFWTLKEFLPDMISRRGGHIVTVASIGAVAGSPLVTDYCASKFAVLGLTDALTQELRIYHNEAKIHTTVVCPMFVDTQLIRNESFAKRVRIHDRFGRLLQPREVAEAVLEGVLRNQTHVFVPDSASVVRVAKLLPAKAQAAIIDFVDCHFELTNGR